MRRALLTLAIAGGALVACNQKQAPTPQPTASAAKISEVEPDPAKIGAFERAVRAEPKVIDLVYDPHAMFQWTIGVQDDGTPRYGYAEYICSLMGDHGVSANGAKVRIVDYQKFMRPSGNARDASLGSVDCQTSERTMP